MIVVATNLGSLTLHVDAAERGRISGELQSREAVQIRTRDGQEFEFGPEKVLYIQWGA